MAQETKGALARTISQNDYNVDWANSFYVAKKMEGNRPWSKEIREIKAHSGRSSDGGSGTDIYKTVGFLLPAAIFVDVAGPV